MRCGVHGLARDLVKDGRNPQLLVLTTCGCYDAKHEAERPFVPKAAEGKARFPISPELFPPEEIELEGVVDIDVDAWDDDAWDEEAWDVDAWDLGGGIELEWTRPVMHNVRIENYEVFRSFAGAAFELIETIAIEYSDFMEVENEPEEHRDTGADDAGTYRYYVEAVTANGRRYRSNTVELEVEVV